MLPLTDQIELELRKIVDAEVFEEWINSPNVELNFQTPLQLLRTRKYGQLWSLIYKLQGMKPSC